VKQDSRWLNRVLRSRDLIISEYIERREVWSDADCRVGATAEIRPDSNAVIETYKSRRYCCAAKSARSKKRIVARVVGYDGAPGPGCLQVLDLHSEGASTSRDQRNQAAERPRGRRGAGLGIANARDVTQRTDNCGSRQRTVAEPGMIRTEAGNGEGVPPAV
jgi:hypothetical protein